MVKEQLPFVFTISRLSRLQLNPVGSMNETLPVHTAHVFQMASHNTGDSWTGVIYSHLAYLATLPQLCNYTSTCFTYVRNFFH
jgi:hypothetical protein